MRPLRVLALRLPVLLYQAMLRPVLGPNCRFTPSCSDYALDALDKHGAARGSALAIRRVLRCNPWCAGGHDPPPAHLSPSWHPLGTLLKARLRADGQ